MEDQIRTHADELETMLHDWQVESGRMGRINDPQTIELAQHIVSLRDAAA
jgi:hypothetical protein